MFLETKMKNGFKRCFGEDKRMESVERETENNKFCCFRLLKKQQKNKKKIKVKQNEKENKGNGVLFYYFFQSWGYPRC